MLGLRTSDRKKAERLARLEGVRLDEEFAKYGDNHFPANITLLVQHGIEMLPLLCHPIIANTYDGSPTTTAYYMKLELRKARDAAASSGTLKEFMSRCRDEFAFHEGTLR